VILTDLKMPTMDGFELLKWLRNESDFQDTPTFVLSSSSLESDHVKAKAFGANGFFQKPMAGQSLVKVLQRILLNGLPQAT